MVEVMKIMSSFNMSMHTLLHSVPPTLQQAIADPCLSPGHSWASLSQSLVGSLFLSSVSWFTQGFGCVLPRVCFPRPVEVLQTNPKGLQSQIPSEFSVPLLGPQVGSWHHQLHGHEFEEDQGVSDGQGTLACCSPWGCKESEMTEQPN